MSDISEINDINEIKELETKLVQSQKKLNDLQYEVNAIHMELMRLKDEKGLTPVVKPVQPQPANVQGQPMQPQPANVQGQPAQTQPTNVQGQPQQSVSPYRQQPVQPRQGGEGYWSSQMIGNKRPKTNPMPAASRVNQQVGDKKPFDTELLVGIKGMGIVASILVFISFILFAMYLIPGLTDTIKMIMMFVVSGIMTGVGLFFWARKKESLFFLSLGACGVGALYISLFVTNLYFHMIDDIPLYILLLAWACGVLFLSRIKPVLFEIIGLAGIVISVFFGTLSCVDNRDGMMMGILAIYLVVGVMAFMILRLKENVGYCLSNGAAFLGAFILAIGALVIRHHAEVAFPCIVLVLFSMILIVMNLILTDEYRYNYLPIFGAGQTAILLMAIRAAINDTEFAVIIILFISVILYVGVEIYYKMVLQHSAPFNAKKSTGVIVWEIFLLVVSTICIANHDTLRETVSVFILFLPLVIYGFIQEDRQSKVSALVVYGILIFEFQLNAWAALVYIIGGFALFAVMMFVNRSQYNSVMKVLYYWFFFVGLHIWVIVLTLEESWDTWIAASILLFIAGTINIAFAKTPFGKNWLTGDDEKGSAISSYAINAFLMLEAVILLYDVESEGLRVIVALITIMLFVINSVSLLKTKENYKVIYVGVKFTVLLICILDSFGAVNYVISISVFVLATLFIMLGFKMQIKSLRVYGLVTTMIFAVKLVMVDIKYDNVLGNALSFFISGLICFGISALYSIADKKLSNKDIEGNMPVINGNMVNNPAPNESYINDSYMNNNGNG